MRDDKPTARDAAADLSWEQDYSPAYRYGQEAFSANPGREFKDAESELEQGWAQARAQSRLDWSDARFAIMDAWTRARDLADRKPD